jgi:hypothetical protein
LRMEQAPKYFLYDVPPYRVNGVIIFWVERQINKVVLFEKMRKATRKKFHDRKDNNKFYNLEFITSVNSVIVRILGIIKIT